MISQTQEFAIGIIWVGGWGFAFFTYPELVCKIFGPRTPIPKRVKWARATGAVALAIVFVSCVGVALFGLH